MRSISTRQGVGSSPAALLRPRAPPAARCARCAPPAAAGSSDGASTSTAGAPAPVRRGSGPAAAPLVGIVTVLTEALRALGVG